MKFGDSFSFGQRLASVQRQFRAGIVVTLFCDFIQDPKFKWILIVAAERENPLFFIINTDESPFAEHNANIKKQQLRLPKSVELFLDHDSWLDCSIVFDMFEIGEIEEALAKDMGLIKGFISKATVEAVLDTIMDAESLSPRDITAISAELSVLL
jgi:hypothetical protein